MRKEIIQLLGITSNYYDELVHRTYVEWCMGFNHNAKALQLSLISKPIQKYFIAKYTEFEHQFLKEIQGYNTLSKVAKNDFYAQLTNQIFETYPGALLPKSSKQQLSNQHLN